MGRKAPGGALPAGEVLAAPAASSEGAAGKEVGRGGKIAVIRNKEKNMA